MTQNSHRSHETPIKVGTHQLHDDGDGGKRSKASFEVIDMKNLAIEDGGKDAAGGASAQVAVGASAAKMRAPRNDNSNPQQGNHATKAKAKRTEAQQQQQQQAPPAASSAGTTPSFPFAGRKQVKIPPTKRDSRKLFIGGLPSKLTGTEFHEFFESYGTVIDSVVMFDRETRRSRGFGFVTFEDEAVAKAVLESGADASSDVGKAVIHGKVCEVKPAVPKDGSGSSRRSGHSPDKARPGDIRHSHGQEKSAGRLGGHLARGSDDGAGIAQVVDPCIFTVPMAPVPSGTFDQVPFECQGNAPAMYGAASGVTVAPGPDFYPYYAYPHGHMMQDMHACYSPAPMNVCYPPAADQPYVMYSYPMAIEQPGGVCVDEAAAPTPFIPAGVAFVKDAPIDHQGMIQAPAHAPDVYMAPHACHGPFPDAMSSVPLQSDNEGNMESKGESGLPSYASVLGNAGADEK